MFIRQVNVPGIFGDHRGGFGPPLRIRPAQTGRLSKSWTQRVRVGSRTTTLGLGSWPVTTLAEAQERALDNRRAIEEGRDPRGVGVPTFEEAAETVIAIHRPNWKPGGGSEAQWRGVFWRYVLPLLGRKRVDKITTADLLRVVTPVWSEKPSVGRPIRSQIGAVRRWAVAQGYRESDPADDAIAAALPKNRAKTSYVAALSHRRSGRHGSACGCPTRLPPSVARSSSWSWRRHGRLRYSARRGPRSTLWSRRGRCQPSG